MTDIALVLDPANFSIDLAMAGADLLADDGLDTAILISLFTDRLADEDDELPDNTGDRRGWWGDLPLSADPTATTDHIGSKLWLLSRAKATAKTKYLAELYCREALQWLLDDGVAQQLDVATQWITADELGIEITITRQAAGGAPVVSVFNTVWSKTIGS